ncbi:T9SS type A sorting domain-containing protein [Maribellus sp. CM-23]|uniref:T9SS type A sorting domain-containing protein n=1 Tax=Maribellus sp. CM-23 TaxID=2781026 RepID=UPI001F3702E3|nr:T9SS type A sorting domain-containing protein [Maribellus sp. CM-23]MCE4564424.1 T9SS type A sorting domain-containing protein [Maribellus sp. CM-23]
MKIFTLLFFIAGLSFLAVGQNPVFNWEKTVLSENLLKRMEINGNNAIIAGYDNAFFKSTDGGASWDTLNLIQPVFNLFDISVKGNTGYSIARSKMLYNAKHDVYADGFIMKTSDGGTTWAVVDAPVFELANNPALSPNDTLCYAIDYQSIETVNDTVAFCGVRWFSYTNTNRVIHNGIFKTQDGGSTWTNISGDMGSNVTSCITFWGDNGFAGGNKHLFKLSANADTVIKCFDKLSDNGQGFINDISMVSENEIHLVTSRDSVFYSTDGGIHFTKYPGIKGGQDIFNVNDSTMVVSGISNNSFVSTDSGQSWKNLNLSTSIYEIVGIMSDSLILLANSAIYKIAINDLLSENYTFSSETLGNGNLQKAYIANENEMTVVGYEASFLKTTDGGVNWNSVEIPHIPAMDRFCEKIDFNGLSMVGDKGYASFNKIRFVDYKTKDDIYWSGGIIYTKDNWETWNFLDVSKIGKNNPEDISMNPNHTNCGGVNTGMLKYTSDDVLLLYCDWNDYIAERAEHGRIFKTMDGGKNWFPVSDDFLKLSINSLLVQGDTMYIGGYKTLQKSTNAEIKTGTSIIDFTNLYPILDEGEDDAMSVNSVWADKDELFVITTSDSCFMSTNGGSSFSAFGETIGSNDFYRFDNNSVMLLGSSTKSRFTNNMTDWVDCSPGVNIYTIGGVYNGKIYALAKGDIYSTSIEGLDIKTSVPITQLRKGLNVYYGSHSVQVVADNDEIERCTLYSINGKMISVHQPNNRTYRFDTRNYQPGIYIVHCVVGGRAFSNKVIFK